MEAASNVSYIPSAMDLLMVVPRLAQKATSFALYHMPDAVDNIAGKMWNGGSIIADPTGLHTVANATITTASAGFVQSTAAALETTFKDAIGQGEESASFFVNMAQGFGKLKNFGGIFSYLTSRWALTTFTVAILLNRTQFYASSRENLRLRFHMRLFLYAIPIATFLEQMYIILQAMKCQTSPDFPQIRYGDPLKHLAIDFGAEGGLIYELSSALLFWTDDAACCQARSMSLVGIGGDKTALRGSMSLLYWFFITLCVSQLCETLTCALQGKQPMPETGMTIFEHSLAFAECEAMISSALGFGFFGLPRGGDSSFSAGEGSTVLVGRSEILQRLNVPPEVLLVCLISCFSHLSSAILATVGIRHKVRLVNTGIWACCYMSAFIWSFARIMTRDVNDVSDLGVLRFPTVCIVGFIPHLLILVGIIVCATIYSIALLVTTMSVPEDIASGLSYRQRFAWAYNNLQANVQFSQSSNIRVKMSEDFYTTLLKIGFNVLTAASEAVYLNEGSRIHVAPMTWLEQKRVNELAATMDRRAPPFVPPELTGEGIAKGVNFVDHQHAAIGQSPYARERRSKPGQTTARTQHAGDVDNGLGITQRRSRMHLTLDFLAGIIGLTLSLQAQLLLRLLGKIGIERRPALLLRFAGIPENQRRPSSRGRKYESDIDSWLFGDIMLPSSSKRDDVDIESETRRMMVQKGTYQGEQHLDDSLYRWWYRGGWFGSVDNSGDYEASVAADDDDVTSVISMSTNTSTPDDQDDASSGRRTPTQEDPFGHRHDRESTPDAGIDLSSLSRLLNPQTSSDREEARLLSYSLQSNRPMTRSLYRRNVDRSRAELLGGLRASHAAKTGSTSEEDDERDLEHFILARRTDAKSRSRRAGTWESGAEGMGDGGPQCVVCQCSPRAILVWPCGCLSMCDDCRVGLATRNYTKCICCRTDIVAYSRLYVP